MKDERIVWRQRNVISTSRRYANPFFPRPDAQTMRRKRIGSSLILTLLLALVVCVVLMTAPIFRITYVLVGGEQYTGIGHSERILREYMQRKRFFVLPQQNFFVFSTKSARAAIAQSLAGNQALADLRITKRFPITIVVQLKERIPHLTYANGGKLFFVDRQGVATAQIPATQKVAPEFPIFYDQTTRPVVPGGQVLAELYVSYLFDLQQALKESTDISVASFYAPAVSCPQPAETLNQLPQPTNANRGTNNTQTPDSPTTFQNTNTSFVNAANRTSNSNMATMGVNAPQETTGSERGVSATCSLQAQVLQQRELYVKTTEGWNMYFRTDDLIRSQVSRLVRVLREMHLDRSKLQYIDLRFGENVVYK